MIVLIRVSLFQNDILFEKNDDNRLPICYLFFVSSPRNVYVGGKRSHFLIKNYKDYGK